MSLREKFFKTKKRIINSERRFFKSIKQSNSNRNFRIIKTNRILGSGYMSKIVIELQQEALKRDSDKMK